MKLLRFLWQQSSGTLALAVITGAVSGVSSVALIAFINTVLSHGGDASSLLLAGFAAICLLVLVARIGSELLLIRLGQNTVLDLHLRLSRRLLAVPYRQLEQIGAARILSSLTDDLPAITDAVSAIPLLCINAAVLLGALGYLGWLSWALLGVVLAGMALGIATYQLPVARALDRLRSARGINDTMYGHFRALTDGAKELKLHRPRREVYLDRELAVTAKELRSTGSASRPYSPISSSSAVCLASSTPNAGAVA